MSAPRPTSDQTPDQIRQMARAMHRELLAVGGGHFAERLAKAFGLTSGAAPSAAPILDFFDEAPAAPAHWQDTRRAGASPDPRGRGPRHGANAPGRTH